MIDIPDLVSDLPCMQQASYLEGVGGGGWVGGGGGGGGGGALMWMLPLFTTFVKRLPP